MSCLLCGYNNLIFTNYKKCINICYDNSYLNGDKTLCQLCNIKN